MSEVLAPLNRSGDRQGVRVEGDEVRTADGFADAYRRYVDAGWGGCPVRPGLRRRRVPVGGRAAPCRRC